MKTVLKVVISIAIIFIAIGAGGIFYLNKGLNSGSELKINDVDLSGISDGIYIGKYDGGRWDNKIQVTVNNHKITKIEILEDVTFPKPEWTAQLFNKIIQEQETNIDVISGATVTSKAYLKSIENALKNQN